MTTDDKTLTEQIARVLNREGWTYEGVHEPGDYDECEDCRRAVDPIAAAVLPIIRKAQAEAWDEGQESGWGSAREESDQHGGVCDMWKPHIWLEPNPYRTEETNG